VSGQPHVAESTPAGGGSTATTSPSAPARPTRRSSAAWPAPRAASSSPTSNATTSPRSGTDTRATEGLPGRSPDAYPPRGLRPRPVQQDSDAVVPLRRQPERRLARLVDRVHVATLASNASTASTLPACAAHMSAVHFVRLVRFASAPFSSKARRKRPLSAAAATIRAVPPVRFCALTRAPRFHQQRHPFRWTSR
jgi:hypothetical protein